MTLSNSLRYEGTLRGTQYRNTPRKPGPSFSKAGQCYTPDKSLSSGKVLTKQTTLSTEYRIPKYHVENQQNTDTASTLAWPIIGQTGNSSLLPMKC